MNSMKMLVLIIIESAAKVWADAEMILKVKEPLESEYKYFRPGLILFTYLHLAADPTLTKALKESGVTAIGYETVTVNRTLPLLTPMSEVAGRMSVQIGAQFLRKNKRRTRNSACRRSWCEPWKSNHYRRRYGRNKRSKNGGRLRCRCNHS